MGDAKYHHRIPQTYMKFWGERVWFYDKNNGKREIRNIDSIMGQYFFHSIKAGSTFQTEESLDKIFKSLEDFKISLIEGNEIVLLDTKLKQNQYWDEFDKWIIVDSDGKPLTKKQRNIIKTRITQISDNTIEEKWNYLFENEWSNIISQIYQGLKDIHNNKSISLTEEAFDILVRYYVMFQWRSGKGYEQARTVYDDLMDRIPNIRDLKTGNTVHKEDKTLGEEVWHEYLLKQYSNFFNDTGVMNDEVERYKNNLTLLAMIDPTESLISSDVPCFEYQRKDGMVEPIFVALPGLIISFLKKDPQYPYGYKIVELTKSDVENYNKLIYMFGNKIISKKQINFEELQ